MICSPQLVGGAEASQKGFRHGMPQNVVSSVGATAGRLATPFARELSMASVMPKMTFQPRSDGQPGAFTLSDSIYDFTAAVGAVPTGKELRMRGLPCRTINKNAPTLQLNPGCFAR